MNVPDWVHLLPHVNATLNGSACVLLLVGMWLIHRGKWRAHACVMISTFFVSVAFLACYLVYHQALLHYTGSGSRGFPGTGVLRQAYLTMLLTHTVLAAFVPVLAPADDVPRLAEALGKSSQAGQVDLSDLALRIGHGRYHLLCAVSLTARQGN